MPKKKLPEEGQLTQEELKAWWPFERLDPKRFPPSQPQPAYPTEEEALL